MTIRVFEQFFKDPNLADRIDLGTLAEIAQGERVSARTRVRAAGMILKTRMALIEAWVGATVLGFAGRALVFGPGCCWWALLGSNQ